MGLRHTKRPAIVVAPLVVMLAVGCSYDWTFTPDPTVGGVGVGSVGDAAAASGDGAADGGKVGPVLPDKPDPTPTERSCKTAQECPKTSFCQFTDKACGTKGGTGVCVSFEVACKAQPEPARVCTCGGTRVDNACTAASEGLDVNLDGSCADPAPTETFACPGADRACMLKVEYCKVDKVLERGTCSPIPSCDLADPCLCVATEGCSCQSPSPGATIVSCAP